MSSFSTPRFYGRRKGRALSPSQQNLLKEALPLYTIEQGSDIFQEKTKRSIPVDLEIGFGQGEHLCALALQNPDRFYIGCEPFLPGIVHLLKDMTEKNIKNIAIFPDDSRLLLPFIPPQSLEKIYVLFADPWPKERHHKRRLITSSFLETLSLLLRKKGEIYLASDHPGYIDAISQATQNLKTLTSAPGFPLTCPQEERFKALKDPFSPLSSSLWPLTRYEQKALESDLPCTYFLLQG